METMEARLWRNKVSRLEKVDDELADTSNQELFKSDDGKYFVVWHREPEPKIWPLDPEDAAKWLILSQYELPQDLQHFLDEEEENNEN